MAEMTPEERAIELSDTLLLDFEKCQDLHVAARWLINNALKHLRFASSAAVQAEREACAKVAERGHCTASGCDVRTTWHTNLCPIGIAAAIRARGEKEGGGR